MEHAPLMLKNFRSAPSPASQPRVSLIDWAVMDCHDKQHLVGFLENRITCRVTTEITCLDLVGREVRTRSGRRYDLLGCPASDPTALAVIAVQVALCLPGTPLDVTGEIWAAMQRTTA